MHFRIVGICLLLLLSAPRVFAQEVDLLAEIRDLRLRGLLAEAQGQAEQALRQDTLPPFQEVVLRLELARIHDRVGLHQNTRPVVAALREIQAAQALAGAAGPLALAHVVLAQAYFDYRAEMNTRAFPGATRMAEQAIERFHDLGDKHGEADAVHLLGLIRLQQGRLEQARTLFDRSLELDQAGGERVFFRGEYERHVGLVDVRSGDNAAALPHFERSLAARREAGAIDASLFAASILASTLVDLGRLDEARPHLLYAMMVAEQIGSPMGKARIGLVLGRLHLQEGDEAAARIAFAMTLGLAESLKSASMMNQAREALERLGGH